MLSRITMPHCLLLRLLLVLLTGVSCSAIPAFPGAEGAGAVSVGGRGGRVIQVTNLIGNRYRMGPSFLNADWTQDHGIIWCSTPGDNGNLGVPGNPSIHIAGNLDHKYHPDPKQDNWPMIESVTTLFKNQGQVPRQFCRSARQSFSQHPVTLHPVEEVREMLFRDAGAARRLDADGNWAAARDRVDRRLIKQYKTGTAMDSPTSRSFSTDHPPEMPN